MGKAIVVVAAAAVVATGASGADRLTIEYEFRDDGGCPDPGHTVAAEYVHRGAGESPLDFRGYARTAPSGGDCRVDALSYAFEGDKAFALGDTGWDGVLKLGADKRSTAAPYCLDVGDDGACDLRPDGNAAEPVVLPAGAAETVTFSVGLGREFGPPDPDDPDDRAYDVDIGLNVVPVDWADGTAGRTLHLGYGADLPLGLRLDGSVDVGRDAFGDVRLSWSRGLGSTGFDVTATARYAWGLTALDGGAPAGQTFAGFPALLAGAPRDDSFVVGVGLTFDLGRTSTPVAVNGLKLNRRDVCTSEAECYIDGKRGWSGWDSAAAALLVLGAVYAIDQYEEVDWCEVGERAKIEKYVDGELVGLEYTAPQYEKC